MATLPTQYIKRAYQYLANTASDIKDAYQDNIKNPETNPWISNMNSEKYNFQLMKFPETLDDPQKSYYGHSMMININVPSYSLYEQTFLDGKPTSIYSGLPHQSNQAEITRNYTSYQNQYSRMETLRREYDSRYTGTNAQGVTNSLANKMDWAGVTTTVRRTRRIKEAILLYMPSTANFVQAHQLHDFSLTELLGKVGVGAAQGAANALANDPRLSAAVGLASGAAAAARGVGTIASSLNNTPINPRIEVIYGSPVLRTFDFVFDMAPSNERESVLIDNIIRTLRFHAAPELANYNFTAFGLQNPFFLTPPSEFDITFFFNGQENTRIPRINTCMLEAVDVDYAATGTYSTFSNGYPVSARMSLRFREIGIQDKLKILEGF